MIINLTKESEVKYSLITPFLILLSSFPATTLYNSNNVAHAMNQNATEQIMITGLADNDNDWNVNLSSNK